MIGSWPTALGLERTRIEAEFIVASLLRGLMLIAVHHDAFNECTQGEGSPTSQTNLR